jgi:tetratricopeptide (TPR) repeat protein
MWVDGRLGLARWAARLGKRALANGHPERASAFYSFALQTFRRLEQKIAHPDRTLSSALWLLSDALSEQGKLEQAKRALEECISIRRRQLLVAPDSNEAKSDLAGALERIGSLLFHQFGDTQGSKAVYEEALQLRRQRASADATDEQAEFSLALTTAQLGSILRNEAALEQALPLLRDSLDAFTQLSARNPSSGEYEQNVAYALTRIGLLHLDKSELDAAREAFENSNYIRQKLATENPSSRDRQIDLGIGLGWLGSVLARQHNSFGAKSRLHEAFELFTKLYKNTPSSTLVARNLWMSMWNLAQYVPDGPIGWTDVAQQMEKLDKSGTLLPADQRFLANARQYVREKGHGHIESALSDLISR